VLSPLNSLQLKGHTPEEALEEAKRKGYKDPILTKIPIENRSYLL